AFMERYGRNTRALSGTTLVFVPATDSKEVELWTPGLVTYKETLTDACYPVSGGWWSVEGDWNPTRRKVIRHLLESENHNFVPFEADWVRLLTFEELQSVHSDHHREM